eukprot:11220423-Ditylum_brightwellii.AAC.1
MMAKVIDAHVSSMTSSSDDGYQGHQAYNQLEINVSKNSVPTSPPQYPQIDDPFDTKDTTFRNRGLDMGIGSVAQSSHDSDLVSSSKEACMSSAPSSEADSNFPPSTLKFDENTTYHPSRTSADGFCSMTPEGV